MFAFAVVVRLDKPEYCSTRLFNRIEGLLINPFDFERVKEAFACCIIVTVALTTHAGV
jgi:hypothetical protein